MFHRLRPGGVERSINNVALVALSRCPVFGRSTTFRTSEIPAHVIFATPFSMYYREGRSSHVWCPRPGVHCQQEHGGPENTHTHTRLAVLFNPKRVGGIKNDLTGPFRQLAELKLRGYKKLRSRNGSSFVQCSRGLAVVFKFHSLW